MASRGVRKRKEKGEGRRQGTNGEENEGSRLQWDEEDKGKSRRVGSKG